MRLVVDGPEMKVLTHPQETKGAAEVPRPWDHLALSRDMLDHVVLEGARAQEGILHGLGSSSVHFLGPRGS